MCAIQYLTSWTRAHACRCRTVLAHTLPKLTANPPVVVVPCLQGSEGFLEDSWKAYVGSLMPDLVPGTSPTGCLPGWLPRSRLILISGAARSIAVPCGVTAGSGAVRQSAAVQRPAGASPLPRRHCVGINSCGRLPLLCCMGETAPQVFFQLILAVVAHSTV